MSALPGEAAPNPFAEDVFDPAEEDFLKGYLDNPDIYQQARTLAEQACSRLYSANQEARNAIVPTNRTLEELPWLTTHLVCLFLDEERPGDTQIRTVHIGDLEALHGELFLRGGGNINSVPDKLRTYVYNAHTKHIPELEQTLRIGQQMEAYQFFWAVFARELGGTGGHGDTSDIPTQRPAS